MHAGYLHAEHFESVKRFRSGLTFCWSSSGSRLLAVRKGYQQLTKTVSMIMKYHNHKLQTNPWHHEEEPHTVTRHQEDKQSKATSSLFPIKMIAKLEWTLCNAQQNIEQLQNPTMGVTINNKSTTTELLPKNGQQQKPLGGLNAFYWYQIFALVSAVVEAQKMFKLACN